jgi:DNA-binding XRE family transcriptional regulator
MKRIPRSQFKSIREKKGFTQRKLAAEIGISQTAYQDWESKPSFAHSITLLILLCQLLSCELQDLLSALHQNIDLSISDSCQNPSIEQIRQKIRTTKQQDSHNSCYRTTIPQRLNELRISKGITQKDISLALDVSESTIQKWENDHFCPRFLGNCIKACEILDVSVNDLVDYIPEDKKNKIEEIKSRPLTGKSYKNNLKQIRSNFKDEIVTPPLQIEMEVLE